MIGIKESSVIFSLISAESRPFDEIFAEFAANFPRKTHYRICSALAILLKDKMLKPSERLGALAIMYQSYSSWPPSSIPFINFLSDASCNNEAEHLEKAFIQLLLGSNGTNNDKEREQLQKQHGNGVLRECYNSLFRASAIKNIVPDPDLPRGYDPNSLGLKSVPQGARPRIGSGDRDATVTGLLQNLSLEGLDPQWIRPPPPMLPVLDGELMWLNLDNNHELLWDHGMCADTSRGAAVRDLVAKALKGPLTPQQEQLLLELASDLKLVYHCGITPRKLPLKTTLLSLLKFS